MTVRVPKNKCEFCVGKPWVCPNCSYWKIALEREKRRLGMNGSPVVPSLRPGGYDRDRADRAEAEEA